ncbi:hypothetical protein SYYSPA8_35855 [Streptomyces yaizuensis]|uniref:Uncharacterized protein n=1 Tax=Streptomyces yaizuensis TaxID=2989713 RepID=A0ABQ5PB21_9ACTN|nr:hypothetical protein SYYSPA8_35855 [Streptomyces sp. YSPA8]
MTRLRSYAVALGYAAAYTTVAVLLVMLARNSL